MHCPELSERQYLDLDTARTISTNRADRIASLDAKATEQADKIDEYSRNLTRRYLRSVRRAEKALDSREDSDD